MWLLHEENVLRYDLLQWRWGSGEDIHLDTPSLLLASGWWGKFLFSLALSPLYALSLCLLLYLLFWKCWKATFSAGVDIWQQLPKTLICLLWISLNITCETFLFHVNRITKSAELEGTKRIIMPNFWLQKSHHAPETIVQTLLELCKAGAATGSLGNMFECPVTLWVKNLSPTSNLNLPESVSHCSPGFYHWSPQIRDQCLPLSFKL